MSTDVEQSYTRDPANEGVKLPFATPGSGLTEHWISVRDQLKPVPYGGHKDKAGPSGPCTNGWPSCATPKPMITSCC